MTDRQPSPPWCLTNIFKFFQKLSAVETNNPTEMPVSYQWSIKYTFATMFPQWTMSLTPSNRRLPNFTDTVLAAASHLTTEQLLLTLSQASFCVGNSLRHHHHHVHEWLEQEADNLQQAAELPTNHYLGGRPVCRRHPTPTPKEIPSLPAHDKNKLSGNQFHRHQRKNSDT